MVRDRSIVCRFNPLGLSQPVHYLAHTGGEWVWSERKVEAFVFDDYLLARAAAQERPYTCEGAELVPWAVVLSGDEQLARERAQRHGAQLASMEASFAVPIQTASEPSPAKKPPARKIIRMPRLAAEDVVAREQKRGFW